MAHWILPFLHVITKIDEIHGLELLMSIALNLVLTFSYDQNWHTLQLMSELLEGKLY